VLYIYKALSLQNNMILTNDDGMAAAFFIIIIIGDKDGSIGILRVDCVVSVH
jgi:ribosomal protein S5